MLRYLVAVALATLLVACRDDDKPDELSPDQFRIVKIRGDQSAQIPAKGASLDLAPAAVNFAVVGEDGYTDEPLVARVEATTDEGILGVNSVAVPPGTFTHWRIEDGGGHLLGDTRPTDDSAYVINRWAPGIVAGSFKITANRLVDGKIVQDAEWNVVVLPGPPASFSLPSVVRLLEADIWRPEPNAVSDAYGNAVPFTLDTDSARSLIDDRTVNGGPWGSSTITVLVADTAVREIPLRVFPDLQKISSNWVFELTCAAPDTTYVDRLVFGIAAADLGLVHSLPAGTNPDDVLPYRIPGAGASRTITANEDTLYHSTANRQMLAMAWPIVDAATEAYVFHNPANVDEWQFRLWSYRSVLTNALHILEGVPERVPLASRATPEWRTTDGLAACHSDGFTNATEGTISIRPHL
jgi:hypothetical protein